MIHNSSLVKKLHSYRWSNNMRFKNSHTAVKFRCHLDHVLAGACTLGRGELGVTVFFLILPFALLNSSEIKWVWHLRKLQFVIPRFSEFLIHGNNLVFTIEIIFSKNIGIFLLEFMEQVSVRVMKGIIVLYIPHYIRKFLRI